MLLDDVVALSLRLVLRNRHILMKLVLLALDHLGDSATHLLDEENVELRIEPVLFVLVQALDRALLAKVLLDDPHDCLLHALL